MNNFREALERKEKESTEASNDAIKPSESGDAIISEIPSPAEKFKSLREKYERTAESRYHFHLQRKELYRHHLLNNASDKDLSALMSGKSTSIDGMETSDMHVTLPPSPLRRPQSTRSKFLSDCIQAGLEPRAQLIRLDMNNSLNVSNERLSDEYMRVLATSIATMKVIEGVNVSHNDLHDDGITTLLSCIQLCPRMKCINISHNKISSKCMEAARWSTFDRLTVLTIRGLRVDDVLLNRVIQVRTHFLLYTFS